MEYMSLVLVGFGFGQLAPLAFLGEKQDADHLFDELVAPRAIGEHALSSPDRPAESDPSGRR